jgi:hypothetical protein
VFETIDDVLAQLDAIIEIARRRGSADGYFAALYRRVTAEVKARIARGVFEDGPRMARFDVVFASRYVDAWFQHERGEKPTACWGVALSNSSSYWPVVMQHLLLGMNAHINLDLGIVAAEVAAGTTIPALKNDFDAINRILAEQVDDVQNRMGQVWPGVRVLDRVGGGFDERLVNFSIGRARAASWEMATTLAAESDPKRRAAHIQRVDTLMSALGRGILNPGWKVSSMLAIVRLRERGSVAEKLDVLLR